MPNELGTIVGTVAGSSVLAAAISYVGRIVSDAIQRRQKATYSALRAAIDLERYAELVATQAGIMNVFDPEVARDPEYQGDRPYFPTFPGYSSDIEWREMKASLTSRCLSFETEIHFAKNRISDAFEVDDDVGFQELRGQFLIRGARSTGLAVTLRQSYGLPALTEADRAEDADLMLGYVPPQ
jgi:hypothetical protein